MKIKKVFVAGHNGMVGSAITRQLTSKSDCVLISRSHSELDLTVAMDVEAFFSAERPDEVYLAAAKVGGIIANNNYPVDFIYQNLQIQNNVISAAHKYGVERLLFLGSSCIYPRLAEQPMREEMLLKGHLEPTNEPYAIAKIAGIKMCESYNRQYGTDFRSVMPSNLYGPGDNYDPENSHVIPGLIRRFHEAKLTGQPRVYVWGTGKVFREFLNVDDLAVACVFLMNLDKSVWQRNVDPMCSHLNVGSNVEVDIASLAGLVAGTVGYVGEPLFDVTKPDGAPRKLMDRSKMFALGWRPQISLQEGLTRAYEDFIKQSTVSESKQG